MYYLSTTEIYHLVLPFRANQKLMFSLCRTCVLTSNSGECHHKTDEEWDLTGPWVIDEVRLALQKGYRILEIHEVYEYKVTRYSGECSVCRLYRHFLKLKAEASGYPGRRRAIHRIALEE